MRFSYACLLGFAALTVAQETTSESATTSAAPTSATDTNGPADSTTASSTSTAPMTHTIGVAKGGHTFEPDITQARVGDTIKFEFYPTNHSVVRAEYGYPCIPYELTGIDKVGFYSGFRPVDAILPDPPAFYVTINDTDPIFFYCGAPGSCINWQMVGVVNPNATTSLQTQKQLAKDSTFMLTPGQPWPAEAEDPFVTSSAAPNPSPTSGSSPAEATSSSASNGTASHSSTLSAGAIAGIAIGAAAVAIVAAVLLYICGRQSRRRSQLLPQDERPGTGHATMHSVAWNPNGHVVGPYMDPSKHMSMHSSVMGHSPALPGYAPSYDPTMSPPLHSAYPMSDSLKIGTGSDVGTLHSTSPSPMHAVPVYPHGMPQQMGALPYSGPPVPQPVIHEMAGSDTTQNQTGIAGYLRRSSISKTNGVERYT